MPTASQWSMIIVRRSPTTVDSNDGPVTYGPAQREDRSGSWAAVAATFASRPLYLSNLPAYADAKVGSPGPKRDSCTAAKQRNYSITSLSTVAPASQGRADAEICGAHVSQRGLYRPSFFLRWPRVRSRSALKRIKPAASR